LFILSVVIGYFINQNVDIAFTYIYLYVCSFVLISLFASNLHNTRIEYM